MAAKDAGASKKKRKRYGWRTPRWRDPWFWAAVGLATLAVAGQVWVNPRLAWTDWAGLGLRAILTWVLISAIIRIRINLHGVGGFAWSGGEARRSCRVAAPANRSPARAAAPGRALYRRPRKDDGRGQPRYRRSRRTRRCPPRPPARHPERPAGRMGERLRTSVW
jgi:hypothetical protein